MNYFTVHPDFDEPSELLFRRLHCDDAILLPPFLFPHGHSKLFNCSLLTRS